MNDADTRARGSQFEPLTSATVDDLRPPSSRLEVGDTCPGTTCFTCPGTTCLAAAVFGFTYHVAQGVKVQLVCHAAGNHSGSGFAPPRLLRTTTGLTAKPYFAQHNSADDVTTSRSSAKAKCLCRLCARAPEGGYTAPRNGNQRIGPPPTMAYPLRCHMLTQRSPFPRSALKRSQWSSPLLRTGKGSLVTPIPIARYCRSNAWVTDSNATGSQHTPPVEQPKPLGGNVTFAAANRQRR
ncbi:hypothetical protein Bbelb_127120 [Branchiostoma belcheri]|nr:hypothetical protein Bbelb_127120 [Branchiostoma belcheri]